MALDKDRLGNNLADAVLTFLGDAPESADEDKLRDLMKALADEIIKEFIAKAVVSTTVTGTLPSGIEDAEGAGGIDS